MKEKRAQILADARKRYADGQRLQLGWTWNQCLSTAHKAAKLRKTFEAQRKELKDETARSNRI